MTGIQKLRRPVGTDGTKVLGGDKGGAVLGILRGPVDAGGSLLAVLAVDNERQEIPCGIDPVVTRCGEGTQVSGKEDLSVHLIVCAQDVTPKAGPGHICNRQLIKRGHGPLSQFVHCHILQRTERGAHGFLNAQEDGMPRLGEGQEEGTPGEGARHLLEGGVRRDGKAVIVCLQDIANQKASRNDLLLFQLFLPVIETGQCIHAVVSSPLSHNEHNISASI